MQRILLFFPGRQAAGNENYGGSGGSGAQSAARAPGGMPREDGNRRAREGSSQVERFSAQSENRFYIRNDKSASVLQRACLPACPTHPVPRPRALARSLACRPRLAPCARSFSPRESQNRKMRPNSPAATEFRRLPHKKRVCASFALAGRIGYGGGPQHTPQCIGRERGGKVLYQREKQLLDSVNNMRTAFCRKVHECV